MISYETKIRPSSYAGKFSSISQCREKMRNAGHRLSYRHRIMNITLERLPTFRWHIKLGYPVATPERQECDHFPNT